MFGKESDNQLIKKALKGNPEAWEKLIGRYERKVYNYALRMTHNREDALDLMQDIFLAVYRNLPTFAQKASFSTWIFRIATYRAIDTFRKRKPTESLERETDGTYENTAEINPLEQVTRNETNQQVLELLQQLTPDQRLVVELKFFQEKTFEEMATLLGISSNTLKTRLYSALKKIKTMTEVAHAL